MAASTMNSSPSLGFTPGFFQRWRLPSTSIDEQVALYNKAAWFKTARGASTICLTAVSLLYAGMIATRHALPMLATDATLFLFLAFFCYQGRKWAFSAAMIMWTLEKLFSVMHARGHIAGFVTVQVVWWSVYMHIFYLGYVVEKRRSLPLPS